MKNAFVSSSSNSVLSLSSRVLVFLLPPPPPPQILHSVGVEFERRVGVATDVDTILRLHTEYTETLFDRCLLNKKART